MGGLIMTATVVSYVDPGDPWYKRLIINCIEKLSGRDAIDSIYRDIKAVSHTYADFFDHALDAGDLQLRFDQYQFSRIPRQGPLVFIANHPFGIIDGITMCHLAGRSRGDFKILLHSSLCRDELLSDCFLPVCFDETSDAIKLNVNTKRVAQQVLADKGTLIIFPAGGVSTRSHFGLGELAELPWTTFTAKIVMQSRATVVPVYFHGENSWLFHFVSAFSQTVRLALLMREVTNKLGTEVSLEIGDPIAPDEIHQVGNRLEVTRYLYESTFALVQGEGCKEQPPAASLAAFR